jgi:hypothetical protein
MTSRRTTTERLRAALSSPVDVAGLAAFRVLFGLVLFAGIIRFMASGWIEKIYVEPRFFFSYWGFEWVRPWPAEWMYVHYGVLAALALCIAIGFCYRASAALFFIGFTYTQLIDVTNYLNHHVLVSLIALLFVFLPLDAKWSVDAWRKPSLRRETVPAWMLWLLRAQIAAVYIHAGLAKATADWLLGAQPLNIWLTARTHTPIIGPWLDELWVAYAASWASFLYDTTIVFWLSWRRSRPFAFAMVLAFHGLTHLWFNIGIFPFIMTVCATIFFAPSWPRRFVRGAKSATIAVEPQAKKPSRPAMALIGAYVAFQALFPLRHFLYEGDVLWNEEGMRFAWKVMVREKHGSTTFYVKLRDGREVQVPPRRYLNARQEREMAAQPDLILQLAHRIARDFEEQGYGRVEVRAESLVSLNGRRARPMIDPTRDLASVEDGLAKKDWILPGPTEPPKQLEVVSWR